MISLYVKFVKIGEMSMYTSVDDFRAHPLIGTHGTTFTANGGCIHLDFNMIELFRALRQYKSWQALDSEFNQNPLKVYTKLAHGLPNPWLHVPYGSQAWLNGHLVLGHVKEAVLLDDDEIIGKCRQSSKFNPESTNTLTIYQGNPLRFSTVTYDITEDCSVMSGHVVYASGSLDHTNGMI